VHGLFQAEGITDDIRLSFVIFLASHDRPMSELLNPNRKDLKQVFTCNAAHFFVDLFSS
jgi:hypothetical protein